MKSLTMMCLYFKDVITNTSFEPYYNIQCGAEGSNLKLKMQPDNTGVNISIQNEYWSEITGMYWAWKNLEKTKYVGLCSYRRFFNLKSGKNPIELVSPESGQAIINSLDYTVLDEIFDSNDIVIPIAYTYPWSIRRVCSKNYNDSDFDILEDFLRTNEPEYYQDYLSLMYKSNRMIGHNMFIMKWDDFQDYCNWVFGVLLPVSQKIFPENYPIEQKRVFGYMHELLLSVYIRNKKMKIKESQILWLNPIVSSVRFNMSLYRFVCNAIYRCSRVLGKFYPHIVTKVR